jgi:hypothetical protein
MSMFEIDFGEAGAENDDIPVQSIHERGGRIS